MRNGTVNFKNRDRLIELGITIGGIRRLKGMTQEQLAEKAGISRGFLAVIEAPNMVQTFSLEILFNIADALDVRPGDLLNNSIFPPERR
jgi:transcriptional regulator with XRE-family HTH domain